MEGRFPNGVVLVLANCAIPAREADMNEWYQNVHIPDVTRSGVFPDKLAGQLVDRNEAGRGW